MNRNALYIVVALALIITIGGALYLHARTGGTTREQIVSTASYLCRDGKTIDATYKTYSVILTLSDTRGLALPQVVSGSGIRYEKEGIVFASKGTNAFLEEGGEQTFTDCVANGSPNGSSQSGVRQFSDAGGTFSFSYPANVTVSGSNAGYTESWMANSTSSGLVLAKAALGKSFQPSTNFSDATLTIGTSANPSAVATCLTYNPSGGLASEPTTESINGTSYTVLRSSDAGAGNRYDTTSYRSLRGNQCYAVEYTIHSTNIGNYDPQQGITEFDGAAVTSVLEGMVRSVQFSDGA